MTREVINPSILDSPYSFGTLNNSLFEFICPLGQGHYLCRMPLIQACCTPTEYSIARSVLPPLDIQVRIDERKPYDFHQFLGSRDGRTLNHTLLAACQPKQRSKEKYIDEAGSVNGVFTYYLCKAIRRLGIQITYQELIESVRHSLNYHGYPQIPQCEGIGIDEYIFSGTSKRHVAAGDDSNKSTAKCKELISDLERRAKILGMKVIPDDI